jgi:Chalcone isomerase-like
VPYQRYPDRMAVDTKRFCLCPGLRIQHMNHTMIDRSTVAVMVCLSLALSLGPTAVALEISGVQVPTSAQVGGRDLTLRGADLLRWKWLVKIYVAALYLPADLDRGQALADIPRRISFHYRRGFSADQLVEATNTTIVRGLDAAAATAIEAELKAFNALYRSVVEGDVMAIDYQPGVGTSMRLNDELIGTVPGAAFARALFAIWVGDQAVDDGLKQALLGIP